MSSSDKLLTASQPFTSAELNNRSRGVVLTKSSSMAERALFILHVLCEKKKKGFNSIRRRNGCYDNL